MKVPPVGCIETRQGGSHVRIECGRCVKTEPAHAGECIGSRLLRRIELRGGRIAAMELFIDHVVCLTSGIHQLTQDRRTQAEKSGVNSIAVFSD